MEPLVAGDLVTLTTAGPQFDAIVFDTPSAAKTIIAVMDRKRGPVMRTVDRSALTERADAGPDDRALQLLMRRTPPTGSNAARGGAAARTGRAGHTRTASHRTTGK